MVRRHLSLILMGVLLLFLFARCSAYNTGTKEPTKSAKQISQNR